MMHKKHIFWSTVRRWSTFIFLMHLYLNLHIQILVKEYGDILIILLHRMWTSRHLLNHTFIVVWQLRRVFHIGFWNENLLRTFSQLHILILKAPVHMLNEDWNSHKMHPIINFWIVSRLEVLKRSVMYLVVYVCEKEEDVTYLIYSETELIHTNYTHPVLFCWSCVGSTETIFFILTEKRLQSMTVDYGSKLNLKKETILVKMRFDWQ
jgi:hypothetical protein